MPFPTTPVLDNFLGPNGSINDRIASPISVVWSAPLFIGHTAASITANAIVAPGVAGDYSAVVASQAFGPDCEAFATYTDIPVTGSPLVRLYLRIGGNYAPPFPDTFGDGDLYELRLSDSTTYLLSRAKAGVGTTIISTTAWRTPLTNGDKFGFSATEGAGGTVLNIYRTIGGVWLLENTFFDTGSRPTSAGYLGFELNQGETIDQFGGGNTLSSPPLPFPPGFSAIGRGAA